MPSSAATARRGRSARARGCSTRPAPRGGAERAPRRGRGARRRRDPRAHERQPVPLRRLRQHRGGHRRGRAMRPFAYERVHDAAGALAASAEAPGARYLAGGTNLVDLMKLGVEQPARLVDVSRLAMDAIEELPDGGLRIGANVRNSDLAVSASVREPYPL